MLRQQPSWVYEILSTAMSVYVAERYQQPWRIVAAAPTNPANDHRSSFIVHSSSFIVHPPQLTKRDPTASQTQQLASVRSRARPDRCYASVRATMSINGI